MGGGGAWGNPRGGAVQRTPDRLLLSRCPRLKSPPCRLQVGLKNAVLPCQTRPGQGKYTTPFLLFLLFRPQEN